MSTMFLLKNEVPLFTHYDFKDWNWLFLNNKEADCILYSEDGHEFRVHKEILSQTETMRSILFGFKDNCCAMMEIFCPCPKDELEQIVKFLYSGTISSDVELVKILNSLIKVFGFPKKLFLTKEELKSHGFDDMDMENQCKKLNVIERPMDTFDTFNETAIDAPTDIITDESENSLVPVNSENSMKKNKKLKIVEKNEFQTGGANLDPAEYTKDVSSDNTELHSITETSDNPMDTVNKTDRDIEVIDIDIINDKSVNSSVSLNSDNNSMKKKMKLKIVERNEFKAHGQDPSKYTKNENLTTAPTSTPNRVLNDNLNINMEKYKYLSKYGCELCDFVAQTKNKYREKQDHLSRVHFKDKIDKFIPKCKPYKCPESDCLYVGKDNQAILRHFTVKHDIIKKWLKEALSTKEIVNSSDSIQICVKIEQLPRLPSEPLPRLPIEPLPRLPIEPLPRLPKEPLPRLPIEPLPRLLTELLPSLPTESLSINETIQSEPTKISSHATDIKVESENLIGIQNVNAVIIETFPGLPTEPLPIQKLEDFESPSIILPD